MRLRGKAFAQVAIAIGLAGMGAVACSSGSSTPAASSTSAAGSPSSAAAAGSSTVHGTPIVIGSLGTFSGPLAQSTYGVRQTLGAWVDWTNANGGINGHPVKLIIMDDALNPTTALSQAQQLVQQDHVMAIVGAFSQVPAVWQNYVTGAGIPVVGGAASIPGFGTDPDFFSSGGSIATTAAVTLAMAQKQHISKLASPYCAESPQCLQYVNLFAQAGKAYGISVVFREAVSASSLNYTAPCLKAKSSGADGLFTAGPASLLVNVAQSCQSVGFKGASIAGDSEVIPQILNSPAMEGAFQSYSNALWTQTAIPGISQLTAAMSKYSPGILGGNQTNITMVNAWAAGQLFAAAAKAVKLTPTSTPADVKAGLYTINNNTLDGLSGPLTFSKGKSFTPTCNYAGVIHNKAIIPFGDGKLVCGSPAAFQALGVTSGS